MYLFIHIFYYLPFPTDSREVLEAHERRVLQGDDLDETGSEPGLGKGMRKKFRKEHPSSSESEVCTRIFYGDNTI